MTQPHRQLQRNRGAERITDDMNGLRPVERAQKRGDIQRHHPNGVGPGAGGAAAALAAHITEQDIEAAGQQVGDGAAQAPGCVQSERVEA